MTYTVKEEAEGVVVTFDIPLDLASMEPIRATQLIEAMMLTAASFDQQLRLDNVVQESWEGFDLKRICQSLWGQINNICLSQNQNGAFL